MVNNNLKGKSTNKSEANREGEKGYKDEPQKKKKGNFTSLKSSSNLMVRQAKVTKGKEIHSRDKTRYKCKICHMEGHSVILCDQIPTYLSEVEPLFQQLKICLKCGRNLSDNGHLSLKGEMLEKHLC